MLVCCWDVIYMLIEQDWVGDLVVSEGIYDKMFQICCDYFLWVYVEIEDMFVEIYNVLDEWVFELWVGFLDYMINMVELEDQCLLGWVYYED